MARRVHGSNQYRARLGDDLPDPCGPDLMAQAAAGVMNGRQRCGEVWGTKCQAWVDAPDYSHGTHGLCGDLTQLGFDPNCPPWALPQLVNSDNPAVRAAVAGNPNLDEQMVAAWAQDPDPSVRAQAVSNPAAAGRHDLLAEASHDADPVVRLGVLLVANVPPEAMAALVQDADAAIQKTAVLHPSCTPQLQMLAITSDHSEDRSVAGALVMRPDLTPDVIRVLVQLDGPDYTLREEISRHPQCPLDVLEQLAQDNNRVVQAAALARLPLHHPLILRAARNNPAALLDSIETGFPYPQQVFMEAWRGLPEGGQRSTLLRNPACPPAVVRMALDDASAEVVTEAIRHRACPADAVHSLAERMLNSKNHGIGHQHAPLMQLQAVVAHRGCSPNQMVRFYKAVPVQLVGEARRAGEVYAAMMNNPACPADIVHEVADRWYRLHPYEMSLAVMRALKHPNASTEWVDSTIRAILPISSVPLANDIARNPKCPTDVLAQLASSPEQSVREGALANPSLPEEYRALHQVV